MPIASFHEVQFPPQISYGAAGGPVFHTTVMVMSSGLDKRNQDWSLSKMTYDVSQGLKTQAELNLLLKFFYARRGKAYGFRFKDWADYQLPFPGDALPTLYTTNGGTGQTFQLTKVYGDAGSTYTRNIVKPVAGTLALWAAGVVTHDWTVDTTTGIVTLGTSFNGSNHVDITGSCQFDVPVRFDTDEMKVTLNDFNNFTWGQIPVVELAA